MVSVRISGGLTSRLEAEAGERWAEEGDAIQEEGDAIQHFA